MWPPPGHGPRPWLPREWSESLMDTMHDEAGTDFDGEGSGRGVDHGSGPAAGRWARHLDSRRRFRRRLAIVLAIAGIVAIIVGLSWHPGQHRSGDGANNGTPQSVTVNRGGVT